MTFKGIDKELSDLSDKSPQIFDKLKGLDFASWNKVIGLPVKPKRGALPFPYPYQWSVFNELMKVENNEKDNHLAWLASRGLGKSEFCIRLFAWLCTKDDSLKGSDMLIITGNRQELSNDLIRRMRNLFKKADENITFLEKESLIKLNGVKISAFPASGHTEAARGLPDVSAIWLDEAAFWQSSEVENIMDVVQGYFVKSDPITIITSTPSEPGDLMDEIFKQDEDDTVWRRIKQDYKYGEGLIYTERDLMKARKTTSWNREMLLRWTVRSGNTFSQSDIEVAKSYQYNPDEFFQSSQNCT